MEAMDALLLHDREIAMSGGPAGTRDQALLESALARPRNLWVCGEPPTLARLAAAYAFGISSNHPFVDGNKRAALLVSFTFLEVNGMEVTASQEDAYRTFWALAAGELSEEALAAWFDRNTVRR